jgi:predicted DNA-binding transcriptional regulator YafY
MNSSERRMKLLLMLQSGKRNLNVTDLADRFNVSRRTIFRDLNALEAMDVPYTYDPDGGYRIDPAFNIPPMAFSQKELATILVGLSFVKSQVDQGMVDDANAVEEKIRSVVKNTELKDWMNRLETHVVVDPYSVNQPQKIKGGNWLIIANAMVAKDVIRFRYNNEMRDVSPYVVSYFTDHWTLIGHCHTRNAFRSFVLDRMSDVAASYAVYKPLKADITDLIFRREAEEQEVAIRVHPKALPSFVRRLPSRIVQMETVDEHVVVRFRYDNLDYVNEWLLQFGTKVNILAPIALKDIRSDYLAAIGRLG